MTDNAKAQFVESIPIGMEDIAEGVVSTADALIRLTKAASETIDLTAMYWALQPNPKTTDEEGWSKDLLITEYGADRGIALYEALSDAAARGVKIRVIQSPGFDPAVDESKALADAHPDQITLRNVNMNDWYGSGIMHQKIWVFDGHSIYIGSANMDWKSLTQVKEIGVVIENSDDVAAEVGKYFDTWWAFVQLDAKKDTTTVLDPTYQISRTVPAWSGLADRPAKNPLDTPALRTTNSWSAPLHVSLNGEAGSLALSGAPHELCVGDRTFDEEMLVNTILHAEESVCVSVMDFAPVSLYRGEWSKAEHKYVVGDKVASPVWWPALVDALLHAVSTKQVHGRLLISEWAHTNKFVAPYLDALAATAEAAFANYSMTAGKLEIRRFRVPGWRSTGAKTGDGPQPRYPGHTRVNHTKYIVTDNRFNIGTSNMTWDYFSGTAGASLNATHPALVSKLQEIFDRDWNSDYALPIHG